MWGPGAPPADYTVGRPVALAGLCARKGALAAMDAAHRRPTNDGAVTLTPHRVVMGSSAAIGAATVRGIARRRPDT